MTEEPKTLKDVIEIISLDVNVVPENKQKIDDLLKWHDFVCKALENLPAKTLISALPKFAGLKYRGCVNLEANPGSDFINIDVYEGFFLSVPDGATGVKAGLALSIPDYEFMFKENKYVFRSKRMITKFEEE